MRDTEGFVQVQVTDIRPEISWTAQPNLGIHICPIHVNLPTVGMDNSADVLDLLLEYTVGRGYVTIKAASSLLCFFLSA